MSKDEIYAAFLETIHLFHGINEEGLFAFAERLREVKFEAGDVIFEKDGEVNSFYLVYRGRVEVIQEEGQKSALLTRGDYIGEKSLLPEMLSPLVKAKDRTTLLELPQSAFEEISETVDFLRGKIAHSAKCRALSRKKHFDWIEEDEVIYYLMHKHPFLFWRSLLLPIFLSFLGMGALSFWWVRGSNVVWTIGVASLIFSVLLGIWEWVDSKNDYYIVTNHRVIWLEKVIGIYDSRQEANLHEIQSVGTETDMWGRYFNYGTVRIRTMVGGITLKHTACPEQAHVLIEELWHRTQVHEKEEAKEILYQAIIDKIEAEKALPVKKRTPPPAPPKKKEKFKLFKKKERHLLALRFEKGGEIIYRKHFVILIRNAGIPLLIALSFFFFSFYQLYLIFFLKSTEALSLSFIVLLFLAGFLALGWMYYQYLDWSNDIFKVSGDKIFDIDRKPFGDVQSRSAPLENIESTEYKRHGLLSIFFNYGTVYIHIGTEKFDFEDVYDPASVQQDVNRRYMIQAKKKKDALDKKERDAMIKWLVAYHQSSERLNELMDQLEDAENEARKRNNEE